MADIRQRKIKIRRKITRVTKTMPVSPFERAPASPKKEGVVGGVSPMEGATPEEEEELPPEEEEEEKKREEARRQLEKEEQEKEPAKEEKPEEKPEGKPEEAEGEKEGEKEGEEVPSEEEAGEAEKLPGEGPETPTEAGAEKIGAEGAKTAEKAGEVASKTAGAAETAGAAGAGEAAAAGGAAAAAPVLPYICLGCAIIVVIILLIIGISLLVSGCSGKSGTTPHQGSDKNLETQTLANAGDIASLNQLTIDDIQKIQNTLTKLQTLPDAPITEIAGAQEIIDRINALPSNETVQIQELLGQLQTQIFAIFDKLGTYIPNLQSSLDNLSAGVIAKATVDVSSRIILFYDKSGKVLGFAPVYFGKKGNSKPDILSGARPALQINKVLDKGEGREFGDSSGKKCGRFILELSGGDEGLHIIGTSPEDVFSTDTQKFKILYATAGDLRMFNSDMAAVARNLKNLPVPLEIKD